MNAVILVGKVIVALIVFESASEHIRNPYVFLDTISKYQLVPQIWAPMFATTIPFLLLILAVAAFFPRLELVAMSGLGSMFFIFAFAQASALLRGLDISCGCFGVESHQISVSSILMVSVLFIVCFLMTYGSWKIQRNMAAKNND